MNPTESIGDRIKAARATLGLSQNDLAERLNTQWQQVSRWERGISEPRKHTRSELAAALEVNLGWLISGEGPRVPSPLKGLTSQDSATELKPCPRRYVADQDEPIDEALMDQVILLVEQYIRLYRKRLEDDQRLELMEWTYEQCKNSGYAGDDKLTLEWLRSLLRGA